MPATVVIADTQTLTKAGLRYLLASTEISIIAETKKLSQLWKIFEKQLPDLLIMDHTKIAGIGPEHIALLHEKYAPVPVLIISDDDDKDTILKLLEAGVIGYLTKDCSEEETLMAIRAAIKGEKFFCHTILDVLIESRFKKGSTENIAAFITERETQIIQLIVKGHSTQKIAQELNLSHHTINSHRKNILKKLKIKSPAELVIYAIDSGLIDLRL